MTIASDRQFISLYTYMKFERSQAPEGLFGSLPVERTYAARIADYIQRYNDGLISSLELYEFMHEMAKAPLTKGELG